MLSPPRYRRIASWICGWLYVVGNITITLAVNFGTTLFLVACINLFEKDDGSPVLEGKAYQVFLIFLAITILCNAVSSLGNRWLPWIDVRFPLACDFVTCDPFANFLRDCCCFLDLCRCDCYHDYHPGCCKERSP